MKNLIIRRLVLFISIYIFIAFPVLGAQELEKAPKTIDDLKQKIEKICEEYNIPGATIALVSKDSTIWAGGIGKPDVAAGNNVESKTIFRWGSISKSFVSVGILMLVERGLIHLDDKIRDIAPEIEFQNQWEATHPVRIVHCLEHTTGFDDLHFTDCAVNNPDITLIEALKINPKSRQSRWEPGTYMSYSNVGPVIAAYIIEKVSGQSFEAFIRENILNPLEMETASFYYPTKTALMSKGYHNDGVTVTEYDHIAYRPAGSLNASAQELANFIQMLLCRGSFKGKKLLNPESVTRIETATTSLAAKAELPFGYGLGNYTTWGNGFVFHGHDGMISGFTASLKYNSKINRGFALSINKVSDRGIEKIEEAIIAFLTAGIEKPVLPNVKVSREDLMSLTGYYRQITPMTQLLYDLVIRFVAIMRITEENGKLYLGNFLNSKSKELTPISKTSFIRSDRHNSRLFIMEEGKEVIISYDIFRGNYKKVSPFWVYLQLGIFLFSLILMLSSILFALIWIPRKIFGGMKKAIYLKARLFPFLAVAFFFMTYILLINAVLQIEWDKALMMKLGSFSILSTILFVFSICFAIFSLLGLFYSIRAFSVKINNVARIHSLLVSIANVVVVIYLFYNNIIGIRTWLY